MLSCDFYVTIKLYSNYNVALQLQLYLRNSVDRVLRFERSGRGFKSCRGCQFISQLIGYALAYEAKAWRFESSLRVQHKYLPTSHDYHYSDEAEW